LKTKHTADFLIYKYVYIDVLDGHVSALLLQ